MVIAAAIAIVLTGPASLAKQPAWLDFSIASYILRYDETHGVMAVHDKKTGYFLARTVECDGSIVTLTLTHDSSEVENFGFDLKHERGDKDMPIIDKPLPNLSTGLGSKIGDTPASVRRKLGEPTTDDAQTLEYIWNTKIGGNDASYQNTYTFKHGKLVEIMFSRDDGVG